MQQNFFITFLSFAFSFTLAFTLYFPFRKLAEYAGFNAVPNARSSHHDYVPNIGGLLFYLSLPVTLVLTSRNMKWSQSAVFSLLSVAAFLIIGLADDRGPKSARQKFIFQCIGVGLFIAGQQWLIGSFFGIFRLPLLASLGYTFVFILVIINAMNLIDGIDGLAASLGLTGYLGLGLYFYWSRLIFYSVFSFSMTAILLAFLYFNFSRKHKMIMGDTGSLWIGFSLSALLIIAVRNMRSPIGINPLPGFPPSMIYGLIIVPVFDLVRVFFIRLIGRRSPFKADRNHIHHLMIDRMGMSHMQATFTIVTANLFLFAVIYFSGYFLPEAALLGIFGILFIVYNAALYSIDSYRAVIRKPVSSHNERYVARGKR